MTTWNEVLRTIVPGLPALLIGAIACVGASGCAGMRATQQNDAGTAQRNVILLIGDGLGASAITMARNYHLGAGGRLHLDDLPHSGFCTTYSVREDDPTKPQYVTDSAASATAIATGRKTSNHRVSTAAKTGEPLPTILELARDAGFRTGLVTDASLADATPAAFASHINYRWCHGPRMMSACPAFSTIFGGPGSIVEQMVAARVDVLFGGGEGSFEQTIPAGEHAGRSALQVAKAAGYRVLRDGRGLSELTPGQPVLGVFAEENMTPRWAASLASFPPPGAPVRCREASRPSREPTLVEMFDSALRLLAADASGTPGFFLMAEAALIDKRAHAADACGQIGDTIELDAVVARARAFAYANPGTLVIVVGDHDHTPQIVDPDFARVNPGITTTLETADGVPMTIAYATSTFTFKQQHTGAQLPIAAYGAGAAAVAGRMDHTDVFALMAATLRIGAQP